MKIRIEQRHIDAGAQGKAYNCPIALAAKEQTGIDNIVCWKNFLAYAENPFQTCNMVLNELAFKWILDFDRDKTSVKPTIIDVPGLENLVRPKVVEPVAEHRPSCAREPEKPALSWLKQETVEIK